jgi:hypothetical protein
MRNSVELWVNPSLKTLLSLAVSPAFTSQSRVSSSAQTASFNECAVRVPYFVATECIVCRYTHEDGGSRCPESCNQPIIQIILVWPFIVRFSMYVRPMRLILSRTEESFCLTNALEQE